MFPTKGERVFYRNLFVILFSISILPRCFAALDLTSAVAEAQSNNPELRVLQAGVAASKGAVTTARTFANPEANIAPGVKRTVDNSVSNREFHGNLEVSQTLKFPGKRALEIAIAQQNVEVSLLALEAFRFQIAAKVRRAFYELLAAQQVVGLRKEQVHSASVFVESARKRAESGYASDFETLKSQADWIAASKALLQAEGKITAARITLNTLLGRNPSGGLEITGTLDGLAPRGSFRDFVALAVARNPSLVTQMRQAEIAGLNLRSARLSRNPDFTLAPSLEYTENEQIFGVGISLPLPLWDQKKGEIQTATAEQKKTLAEIEKSRAEIAGEVTKAAANLQIAKDSAALYTPEFLDKMKALVAQAEQGYAQNATTLIIYLDAKRTYFDSLSDYYESLSAIADSRADLESAVGVPIDTKP